MDGIHEVTGSIPVSSTKTREFFIKKVTFFVIFFIVLSVNTKLICIEHHEGENIFQSIINHSVSDDAIVNVSLQTCLGRVFLMNMRVSEILRERAAVMMYRQLDQPIHPEGELRIVGSSMIYEHGTCACAGYRSFLPMREDTQALHILASGVAALEEACITVGYTLPANILASLEKTRIGDLYLLYMMLSQDNISDIKDASPYMLPPSLMHNHAFWPPGECAATFNPYSGYSFVIEALEHRLAQGIDLIDTHNHLELWGTGVIRR